MPFADSKQTSKQAQNWAIITNYFMTSQWSNLSHRDAITTTEKTIVDAAASETAIQISRSIAINKLGHWFENKLSRDVLSNSIYLSVDKKNIGNSQYIRDLQTVKSFLTSPGLVSILDIPWGIIFISVLFMLHRFIGLLAIISIFFLLLVIT